MARTWDPLLWLIKSLKGRARVNRNPKPETSKRSALSCFRSPQKNSLSFWPREKRLKKPCPFWFLDGQPGETFLKSVSSRLCCFFVQGQKQQKKPCSFSLPGWANQEKLYFKSVSSRLCCFFVQGQKQQQKPCSFWFLDEPTRPFFPSLEER